MTLAVATNYNDKIRASIDVVGISNFNTFLKNTETYRRDLRRVEYGDERDPKMYEFLEKISPLTNAHKITKPLFVIQGKNDPRVPYTEAEQIVAAARKNNTPVWFLMADDEGHGFGKKNNVGLPVLFNDPVHKGAFVEVNTRTSMTQLKRRRTGRPAPRDAVSY